ncbi:MAG: uroporphyrinogen decarboxylase family protein [Thermodesulfobacteriota bacterium]
MTEMTSRERVLTAMDHREPDRVPLYTFSMDPKFIKALGGGLPLAAYEALGLDVYPLRVQCWCQGLPLLAGLTRKISPEYQTGGGIFAGWDGVDEFGRVWKRGSYVGGALKNGDDLERYDPPLKLEERSPSESTRRFIAGHPDKVFSVNIHLGPFGLTMESVGFEDFFFMLFDHRDLVREILRRRTDWFISVCRHLENQGADFLVMGDDVAFKNRTFVSPADFKELAIPCYRRIAESLGVPLFWHSDGFIEPLIEMAVEAGIRGLHAVEPTAGNDLGRIKQRYGDRLVLMGNVDAANVLTGTDLAAVRREVDRCLTQAKAGGGYMLDTSNSLHAACTVEAVVEMYRYGQEAGRY